MPGSVVYAIEAKYGEEIEVSIADALDRRVGLGEAKELRISIRSEHVQVYLSLSQLVKFIDVLQRRLKEMGQGPEGIGR